jgi:hypothetical protein
MPGAVARELRATTKALGIRLILLRRPGRRSAGERHVYFARTDDAAPRMAHAVVDEAVELLRFDLSAVTRTEADLPGRPEAEPLFLVCTNGRRDPCCAERGRSLFRALEELAEDRVWECSHIGGDRFAGNVVCFPLGLYYGRVEREDAGDVAAASRNGEIDLRHFRGRTSHPMPVQAAEAFARQHLGERRVDGLRLVLWEHREDGSVEVRFDRRGDASRAPRGVRVDLTVERESAPQRLTCHAGRLVRPPRYRLIEVEEEPGEGPVRKGAGEQG